MTQSKHWQPFTYDGKAHSLDHLHPHTVTFTLKPSIAFPNAATYAVRVTYGLHCFTVDAEARQEPGASAVYCGNPEGRLFSPTRWEHSKLLPNIIAMLGDRNCYPTERENYLTLAVVTPDGPREYAIFFRVSAASEGSNVDANLLVQSAHFRAGYRAKVAPKRFTVILGETIRKARVRRGKDLKDGNK